MYTMDDTLPTIPQRKKLKDLNELLTCRLCHGYLIDATRIVECHHVFCRGCILRHFENSKSTCPYPQCNVVYKKKSQHFFLADKQLQAIVYKVVPALYGKEMQRRDDFYRSTGVRATSSCSDDSVLEKERENITDEDCLTLAQLSAAQHATHPHFFGPEDTVSLSLEYYQSHLDFTDVSNNNNNNEVRVKKEDGDKRFLQCPAAVTMQHLQKFVRMKYALTANHRVDIIYKGEVLPIHFSLMDVAYTFKWERLKPLRFFYRIFTPMKVQPIKIVTTLSSGGKQLQIVKNEAKPIIPPPPPIKTKPPLVQNGETKLNFYKKPPPPPPTINNNTPVPENKRASSSSSSSLDDEKERLMANLHLKKNKSETSSANTVPTTEMPDCVFEYEEPDKEEIKRFAEIRDQEWAMQKRLEENRATLAEEHHRFNRKRKKNKHRNNEVHKKRKLHAEITNKDEEELKLKVKLTTQPTNGHHKHKHHKAVPQPPAAADILQNSAKNKEKLLEMRQIRHKIIGAAEPKAEKKVTIVESAAPQPPPKIEKQAVVARSILKPHPVPPPAVQKPTQSTPPRPATVFERKIATLQQQRAAIEKSKKVPPVPASRPVVPPPQQYPPGFTVSKIENGVKRPPTAEEKTQGPAAEKRPSLEITLINPQPSDPPPKPKRPPPATIPLDRIKKSFNFNKSGISIVAKSERCDNIGALDLSKKEQQIVKANGFAKEPQNGAAVAIKNNLSNLQMLSKVATEHQTIASKPRPQLPALQTLKIPSLVAPPVRAPHRSNLDNLPKLTEINKSFRMHNLQIRNLRPNNSPNQSIRNIPNPSLLVRQQNQNRLNSMATTTTTTVSAATNETTTAPVTTATTTALSEVKSSAAVLPSDNKK